MKKLSAVLALLFTLVWLAGCTTVSQTETVGEKQGSGDNGSVMEDGNDSAANPTEEVPSTDPPEAGTQSTATMASQRLTRQEVKRIALERADVAEEDVTRYEAELDYDDDAARWEYEIGFYVGTTEYDLEIDAVTGDVLRYETETEKKATSATKASSTRVTSSSVGRITKEEAKRIALEQAGASEQQISRYTIELDYDDDARRWEYEISFRVGNVEYDIELAAKDGKVLQVDKETEREPVSTSASKATVSKAKAKSIALNRAGVSEKDVSRYEIELDYDDDARRWEYEISFNAGSVEYDIKVDGTTGEVLEYEKDVD